MLAPCEILEVYFGDSCHKVLGDDFKVLFYLVITVLNRLIKINERVSARFCQEFGSGSPLHVGEHKLPGYPRVESEVVFLDHKMIFGKYFG